MTTSPLHNKASIRYAAWIRITNFLAVLVKLDIVEKPDQLWVMDAMEIND